MSQFIYTIIDKVIHWRFIDIEYLIKKIPVHYKLKAKVDHGFPVVSVYTPTRGTELYKGRRDIARILKLAEKMASKFNVNIKGSSGAVVVGDNATLTIHERKTKGNLKMLFSLFWHHKISLLFLCDFCDFHTLQIYAWYFIS